MCYEKNILEFSKSSECSSKTFMENKQPKIASQLGICDAAILLLLTL